MVEITTRTVLIVGGTSGIGRGLAQRFADAGSAASRALDLLGAMVRPDNAGHLSDVLVLDMEVFAAAMSSSGAHPQTTERVVASGIAGARRLAGTVGLLG